MRRTKAILATFLLFALPLIAQDTTKPFYFPHKTGDMWEYRFSEYGDPFSSFDTIQVFTISDSTDSSGIIHLIQHVRLINPIGPPYIFFDTTRYWIDTTNHYVYGFSTEDAHSLVYKLDAKVGEQWITHGIGEMARVTDIWEGIILGEATTFMNIRYYGAANSTDTSGLDRYYDVIADGFGLVHRAGIEASTMEIDLKGAIINRILYGDTTLVTVKNNNNLLPLDIKLYQNFPNPFNPKTVIGYQLPVTSKMSLKVFNILGQEVAVLVDEKQNAGSYEKEFNAASLSSGMYIAILQTSEARLVRRMLLLK